jgi:hypothetical protein
VGGPLSLALDEWRTNPHHKKKKLLQNVTQGLGTGWILWNDLGNGKWIWDLEHGMLGVYKRKVH